MNTPGDFNSQLGDLAVILAGKVAERLAYWSKDMEPGERKRILDMIEEKLPTIIANSIAKAPSLHSAAGIDYFQQNIDSYADSYAKKFINLDG
jgi:hypothetical protein